MNIKRLINYKKFISVITAICLLVSFVIGPTAASAINNEQTTKEYNQIFKEFILPYSYGKVTKSHFAGTDRVIINIQDLHCHPKVQKNIANIIESFDKKFGVNKIYLEGAYGDVNTKWISDSLNNNKHMIEQMLDTGRLTGAEYYSALSGKTGLIKGLENKEPYLDNIKRLGQILQNQEKIDLILKSLNDSTEKIKKKYYTKRQYKLEDLFRQYKEGKIPSQKYYLLLSKHIDKLGIDLTKYENTLIYLTLLELQKDLNYKQITKELHGVISLLKQQLPYKAYSSLLENTNNFKEIEKLYSYIIQLDKTFNLNISLNFKELDKYFRYVELSKKINPVELVKEDEFLIQEINTRFSQTKAHQEIVFLIYFEKYLKDYLTTKITLDDYKYYKNNIEKYEELYNKHIDNRIFSLLKEYIAETDKFYSINLDRNIYFTKNMFKENELLKKIENPKLAIDDINKIIDNMQQVKKLDIVITGGFHSQTVTDLLEKQNVSYIVITPNVTDGIKLAEDTYYKLAKEQSEISFQTIAPVIASLSPQLQKILLEKIGKTQKEEIDRIISLDDTERTRVISELIAASLLESDDLGTVETKIQDVIKAVVDDLHKEKITPELISQIKNLQQLIKDTDKLQKVIDLLQEGTIKQSVMLIKDMFENLYTIFDSFVSFANKKLAQQEQLSSAKYIEDIQSGKSKEMYYDALNGEQDTAKERNTYDFFIQPEESYKKEIKDWIKKFFGDKAEIKEGSFNKSGEKAYLSVINFILTDKITGKEYEISLKKQTTNLAWIDFSIEIKGDSNREKFIPYMKKLAEEVMAGKLKEEKKKEEKDKDNEYEKHKTKKDFGEKEQSNIKTFFEISEKNIKNNLIEMLGNKIKITGIRKDDNIDSYFLGDSRIVFDVENENGDKYKISIVIDFVYGPNIDRFGIEIKKDEGKKVTQEEKEIIESLMQEIMTGNFKIEAEPEIKQEKPGTSDKTYYDEVKEKKEEISNNINKFFDNANKTEIIAKARTVFGNNFEIKEDTFNITKDDNFFYPTSIISFVIKDKTTQKEYEISVINFGNLGYMNFSMKIKGYSDREKYISLLDRFAQEIMNGNFNFEIEEEVKPESEGKNRKIYYDEAEEKQEEISRNINEFFNRAEINKTEILSLLNGIFSDTFKIEEETVNINKNSNPFYPTSIISFVVKDNITHKEYKISMTSFINLTTMDFSIEIEGDSDRKEYTVLLDKLAQKIMKDSFNIETKDVIGEKSIRIIYGDTSREQRESLSEITQLREKIITASKNDINIIEYIKNIDDILLLNAILKELQNVNIEELNLYCKIISIFKSQDSALIFCSLDAKSKKQICDFYEYVLNDYTDDISSAVLEELLIIISVHGYTKQDFYDLTEILSSSRMFGELRTKENIIAFLSLDRNVRNMIYEFYKSSYSDFSLDFNSLSFKFILMLAKKYNYYNYSKETFNYIMELICKANLNEDSEDDRKYVNGFRDKNLNVHILENFKYINIYNRYLIDLLFSDIEGQYVDKIDIQKLIDLFDALGEYNIKFLDTENNALSLMVLFSNSMQQYCEVNGIKDVVKQYQLAIRVARKIYSISGDNIFTVSNYQMGKIIEKTLNYYNKIDKIVSLFYVLTDKTAVFSLHNNERISDGKIQRFTPAGIKEILKILDIKPKVSNYTEISFIDRVLYFIGDKEGRSLSKMEILDFLEKEEGSPIVKQMIKSHINSIQSDTLSKIEIVYFINSIRDEAVQREVESFLRQIEHFNIYEQENGLFLFDGHGLDDTFYYSDNGGISSDRIAQALIEAHNNGVDLSKLTLIFSCCRSYNFAGNITNKLIINGITNFPQIITDAGKETSLAYDRQMDTSFGNVRVSNLFYSLIKYLKSETSEERKKGGLTFKQIADAPRYLSNNTLFITNKEIDELNRSLEKELRDIIEEDDDTYKDRRAYPIMINTFFISAELNKYVELQKKSTINILNKIGNNKIIKQIYKEKSGDQFRFTKFGVAIGVLLETFSLWKIFSIHTTILGKEININSFIEDHENPTMGQKIAVWVIRALSIGIGLVTGSIFAVFLTETITHFIWNIIAPLHLRLQLTGRKNIEITTTYDKNDYVIVLLITKEDGTQYSVRLALTKLTEDDKVKQDYIETGVPDKKMIVYLSSINDDAFSMSTTKYKTLEYIERITGVKIEVSENTITAKSSDPETQITFVRNKNINQTVSSLTPKQLPAIEQQEQTDVESIAESKIAETIYLDESQQKIVEKFQQAIKNNSLIVVYPFSNAYDIDSLTDEQLYSLYFDIQNKFFNLQENLNEYLPKIDDRRTMAYVLKEFIKNAFVHGNLSDLSKPIYVKFIKNGFTVINTENTIEDEKTKLRRLNLSSAATLTGAHRGLQVIRGYEEQGLIKVEQEIKTKEIVTADDKKKEVEHYIVSAVRTSEDYQSQIEIDFNSLIQRVFKIIPLVEQTNNKYPNDRAKSMDEAGEILSRTFTPEELEIIDLLASTIFDSIKYVNSTRDTSAVEFVNIIYSLQNGLFNDNFLTYEGDLKQHILDMLEHYVEISKHKKGSQNILVKTVNDNENVLNDMANFLSDIIVKNNLVQKSKQQKEVRRKNIEKFIEGVQKDDTSYSAVMICSANENRSAIWHIMFENFLKKTKRTMTRVLSAGVFYDISQEVIRQTGQARVLRDDYHETLTFDERYQGVDESIKSGFRSTYIKYLRLPKGSQQVFIVAGEQHRAQLIKLGYDPNWIFLMSEFYSDDFKTDFKQSHESLGKELEENNIFSMSEYPDPFEEQILRQDLPELTKSLIEYVFKTKDDTVRENLPEKFVKFTDDYNQFEHMEDLPSFAFTDAEKREAAREFYEDDISNLAREKQQFEFRANTKYLYILQNINNKEALFDVISRNDAELKFKLFALMYLSRMQRGLSPEELELFNNKTSEIVNDFKKQLENNSFIVSNNFDLRAYIMGVYLMFQGFSIKKFIPNIVYKAFIINRSGKILADSDGYFAEVDLFKIIHELTHVIVGKPSFYNHLAAQTVDELVSYVTPNMFLSIVKLSLQSYSKLQTGYTIHQKNGLIDYVKMGKKLHVLYNLFSKEVGNYELKQEEHSAPIAFLELLFNAHKRIGKDIDWAELMESIRIIDDENLDQSSMFGEILDNYTEGLVIKGAISQQEADNLIKEIEKIQLWTLLSYNILQNIKDIDMDTYVKIVGSKDDSTFEKRFLSKPSETKEQIKMISDIIKTKGELSGNDILTLLIIDIISDIDYEYLINNFDGVIEGIIKVIKGIAQVLDMQKDNYSISEYEQISKIVTDNYTVSKNPIISVMDNFFEYISNSLNQLFFIKSLINKVFGIKDMMKVLNSKQLLIVKTKQQEENLKQVLKDNNIANIEVVTMEVIRKPIDNIRSDMYMDVQKGIRAKYDSKENKITVYSKQGINISDEEIEELVMQAYFDERSEDIIDNDVIAFAAQTDISLDDITDRLKTAYTASVTMPNKETKFDLSSKPISNIITTCKQEFTATGIRTFVINQAQMEMFTTEIKSLQEQGFRFVISCKSDNITDITDYDGLIIDATAITNINQAIKFMESIRKKVLTQGVAKQVSIKFKDDIYGQFEHLSMDIFNNFGIIPVMNAEKIKNIGKYEVENITENNIDNLLRNNNVIGLVIDNARVFIGKKSLIKQLFSKEHKYNKGYNASLNSKFDYICYDVSAFEEFLNIDINNDDDLNKLKNIDLSVLSLSSDSLTYLEYLNKKGNYEEMAGFIRGMVMNTARAQIIKGLKEKEIDLDMEKFAKEANGKYQKAFLTVAVQLMLEGIDVTKLLETDFIDSNMTTKQYLDSVYERVNINIEDILKKNGYRIERTKNPAQTIEDFKNYVVLLDNLRIIKETTVNFDMSMKAVRNMLAAA